MRNSARDAAIGRWRGILSAFGIDPAHLTGKHTACPVCGGKDRFRFDDKDGRGTFYCSGCGAGDGFQLIERITGWTFADTAREIERIVGMVPAQQLASTATDAEKLSRLRRIWSESRELRAGDDVVRYLSSRSITLALPCQALRLHPNLPYRDPDGPVRHFPAMLARVSSPGGTSVSIHRTYLLDGKKAPTPSPRKLMPGLSLKGAAIRLQPATHRLGVAEGIETALAAAQLFHVPVWSCISANGLESFEPPPGVAEVQIFGDADRSGTGQAAAWALAKRLTAARLAVEVQIPPAPGTDWADYLQEASHG